MAYPNIRTLTKEIPADGIIVIDVSYDGLIQQDGVIMTCVIRVQPNGTDPETPLRGIKWVDVEQQIEFGDSEGGIDFRLRKADANDTITVVHNDTNVAGVERIFLPALGVDGDLQLAPSECHWAQSGAGHNRCGLDVAA